MLTVKSKVTAARRAISASGLVKYRLSCFNSKSIKKNLLAYSAFGPNSDASLSIV